MKMEGYKLIGKPHTIKVDNKIYEYQIIKWDSGRKTIQYKGIVTYPEYVILKEKLSKKYKWLKESE